MIARIVLAAALLTAQTAGAETPAYRFSRPIEWRGAGQEELLAVPLDSRIYAATRADFADLRIVDQNGVETPYLLEKVVETKTETSRLASKSELLGLKKKGAKAVEITLRLDKDAVAADGLTVHTPLVNFEHRLQVFGSVDGENWTQLVKDAEIYDYSRYMVVSNRDVSLPANSYRQFKVVVEEAVQTREADLLELTRTFRGGKERERSERVDIQRIPLHIENIAFWHNRTDVLPETEKKFVYPVAGFKVSQDAENQATVIDVTTLREPLTGFALQTPVRNFNRVAAVLIPVKYGIETRMQEIGSATLESLHFRDINRDQSGVSFPEQRREDYRIVIRDQDNPPLDIAAVTGIGNGYSLLFLPLQGKTYSLRYGMEKAELPRYDTAPIQELLRRGYRSVSVSLGSEAAVPVVETWDFARLLNSKPFLGAVVALMVAVLAWSLVRAGRRIEQFPKE
jgi:hypothetical protein